MTRLLLKIFVKNPGDTSDVKVREGYGTLSGGVGIAVNLILCIFKMVIGIFIGSMSVLADGLNNLTDMGSSIITTAGFKLAAKPADKDHPFGHGRVEYLSAFIVSMLILLVGFELIKGSAEALFLGKEAPRYLPISYIILGFSVILKLWLYFFNKKLGKKISSDALLATAQDSFNDAIATTVIIIAAIVSTVFKLSFNLDAVMGILVGLFIIYSGIMSAKETVDKLLGEPPGEELLKDIEDTVLSFSDFEAIHDLIVHNYGPGRCLASVHVEVSQNINIVHCHEQVDLCEKLVLEKLGVELTIHSDPIDTDSSEVAEIRAMLSEKVKEIHEKATIHDFRMTPLGEKRTNLIFDAVLPTDAGLTKEEYAEKISGMAREINKTFVCVITVDTDYTGR